MTTKKKLKYDENKKITLINDVEVYNEIGFDHDDAAGKGTRAYNTRKPEGQNKDNSQPTRIDQSKPVNKKKIAVPETKDDDRYYTLIEYKKENVERLNQNRGYKRIFQDDNLPNPDLYFCTDEDLQFISKMNSELGVLIRPEDFQTAVQLWESEIGRNVMAEKKRLGTVNPETNRLSLESAKAVLKDGKEREVMQVSKLQKFGQIVDQMHKVGGVSSIVLGLKSGRKEPPSSPAVLEQLHQDGSETAAESVLRAAQRESNEDSKQRRETQRQGHPRQGSLVVTSSRGSRPSSKPPAGCPT